MVINFIEVQKHLTDGTDRPEEICAICQVSSLFYEINYHVVCDICVIWV